MKFFDPALSLLRHLEILLIIRLNRNLLKSQFQGVFRVLFGETLKENYEFYRFETGNNLNI